MAYINSRIGETSQTTSETVGPPGPRGDIAPQDHKVRLVPKGKRVLEGRLVHKDPRAKWTAGSPRGGWSTGPLRARWTAGSKRRQR